MRRSVSNEIERSKRLIETSRALLLRVRIDEVRRRLRLEKIQARASNFYRRSSCLRPRPYCSLLLGGK